MMFQVGDDGVVSSINEEDLIYVDKNELDELVESYHKLEKENEQLKQRNNRQAKQLDRLYHLIEEKDWRTLSDIIDDFKRCEEQLQREWGTYGDFE